MWILRSIVISALALVFGMAAPARAQTAEGDSNARRNALYAEGRALSEAQRWDEAAAKFRAVTAIRETPKALIALAYVERKRRHLIEAKNLCERALQLAKRAGAADDVQLAEVGLRDVLASIPRVFLRLPADVPDFDLEVDGKAQVYPQSGILLDPGRRRIVIRAAGRKPYAKTLDIEQGEVTLSVVLPPASERDRARDERIAPTDSGRPVAALVLGGAGVLVAAGGAYLVLSGRNDYDNASASCGSPNSECTQATVDDGNDARTRIIVGDVLLGVGITAVGASAVWWFASPQNERAASKPAIGLRIGAGGASVRGQF